MKWTSNGILLSTVLTLSSISVLSTQVYAAPATINIQSVLQQERAWAGLSSKKIKVADIEWAYSEG